MNIIFSNHAKDRLMDRQIDAWKVTETVKKPDWKEAQSNGTILVKK